MIKKKMNSYNDGVASVYSEKKDLVHIDFNAKKNARTIEDYDFVGSLCYTQVNARIEDFEFAESIGKVLTMKIKTPLVDWVKSKHKIILGYQVYDIIKIDPDLRNRELYVYLESGRKLCETK